MSFLYGILGTIFAMALFVGGAVTGWKLNIRFYRPKRPEPEDPVQHEKEMIQMAQEQEAWRAMQDYSVERAYGLLDVKPNGDKEGGDE